jgi:cytochrome c oxidase subunit I
MSTSVVHNPAGFDLPSSHNTMVRWMLYVGFGALSLGFLNGAGQALNYAGIDILKYFPGMRTYYQGLTAHGVLNAIVLTFAFANGFLALTTARALGRPLNLTLLRVTFGLLLAGTLMAGYAIASGQASVLYTFYPPLQGHPLFYLGLALIVVSTWTTTLNLVLGLNGWRKENPGARVPLMAYVSVATYLMWLIASLGIAVEVVGLLLPWSLGWIENSDPLLSRSLFWFSGHAIVYFWLLPAYVSWYMMIPKHAGGTLFSDTITRVVFLMFLVLSIPVGFHHQYTDPGIGQGMKAAHAVLTFGVFFPSLITAFSVMWALEIGGRRRGAKGLLDWFWKLDWGNPVLSVQLLAMLTFLLGGATGLINASYSMNQIVHNTTWMPGHFHMTVGSAVTMSIMGIAYWMIPYLKGRELWGRKLALAQGWIYFVGVLIFARGMISGGLDGMPRRTMLMDAPYSKPSWELAGIITGVGGTIMLVGGILFFVVLLGTIFLGKEKEGQDVPFTETVQAPTTTGWSAGLDRFWVWVTVSLVLIILAYAPFFIQRWPGNFVSPGLKIF